VKTNEKLEKQIKELEDRVEVLEKAIMRIIGFLVSTIQKEGNKSKDLNMIYG